MLTILAGHIIASSSPDTMILKLARFVTLWLLQAGLLVADKKVPGDNPLSFCSEDPAEDVLHIDEVTLIPDPPVR